MWRDIDILQGITNLFVEDKRWTSADFISEYFKERRDGMKNEAMERDESYQPRISYPAKDRLLKWGGAKRILW